jgi:tetratricopeptide (TPR) repeat protein
MQTLETNIAKSDLAGLYRSARLKEYRALARKLEAGGNVEEAITGARNLAICELEDGNYTKSLEILLMVAPLLSVCADSYIKGNCRLTRANTFERIAVAEQIESYFDRALVEYENARDCYTESNHHLDCWHVENCIAFLLIEQGKPQEAFDHLARARAILSTYGQADRLYRLAEVDDTEALAWLNLNNISEAFNYSSKSISALINSTEFQALTTAKETMRKILG